MTAHCVCLGQVEIVRLLLSKSDIDINKSADLGATALYIASQKNYVEVVRLLLSKSDIDINRASDYGFTPLEMANDQGYTELVKLLEKHNNK